MKKVKKYRKGKSKNQRGITLVALVVTIVILIILASVTINAVLGDGGLIKQAEKAKDIAENSISKESGDMNRLAQEYANMMAEDNNPPSPEDKTPPTVDIVVGEITETSIAVTVNAKDDSGEISSYKYYINEVEKMTLSTNTYKFEGLTAGTEYTIKVEVFDKANNKGEKSITATTKTASIPTTSSYVGYYADLEGEGTVDGIIYADLAKGNTGDGQWSDSDGNYTIPVKTNLKDYYISKKSHSGDFGTKDVISPIKGQSGKNDRFYIMELEDFNAGTRYCWYDAAYGNMSDYSTATSKDFGTGKANTNTMITKWNNNSYGAQNDNGTYLDMWGVIQDKVAEGWFVPSKAEWSAFAEELGITKSNYQEKGLTDWYWSSSQRNTGYAWNATFGLGYMGSYSVDYIYYVRLSTTF